MTEHPPGVSPDPANYGYSPPPGDFSFSPSSPGPSGYLPTPPGEFDYSPSSLGAHRGNGANRMAVMSIVASGVGWVCCGIGAIVGPIFGIIALSQIKRTGEGGRNLAIAGITVGGVILVGLIIFWTAAFISAGNDDSYHQTHYRRGYGMVVPAAIPPVAAITAPAQ